MNVPTGYGGGLGGYGGYGGYGGRKYSNLHHAAFIRRCQAFNQVSLYFTGGIYGGYGYYG